MGNTIKGRRPRRRRLAAAAATVVAVIALPALAGPPAAGAAPLPLDNFTHVPPRTALAFHNTLTNTFGGTANQHEPRSGLSMVKLYITDFALRRGDRSPEDFADGERMIRFSDNGAANRVFGKYRNSIDEVAREFGLSSTRGAPYWGQAFTSAADLVKFLAAKRATDPGSPILTWMGHQDPVNADGIAQNYGTSHLPGSRGSKWGISGYGPSVVASASYGSDFTVAAITFGGPDDQTADVLGAFDRYPDRPTGMNFLDALGWEFRTFFDRVAG